MLLGATAELASLGAVLPFLALMADPAAVSKYPLLASTASNVGIDENEVLLAAALLFGLLAVAAAGVRLTVSWATHRFTFGIGRDLGVGVFSNCLAQPYSWHVTRNSSDSLAAINKVQIVVNAGLLPIISAMVAAVIAFAIVVALLIIDAKTATAAAGGFVGSYLLISILVRSTLAANGKTIATAQRSRIQVVQEALGGIRDVILDQAQGVFHNRYEREERDFRKAQAINAFLGQAPRYALEGLALLIISFLAYRLGSGPNGMEAMLPTLGAIALGGQKLMPLIQQIYSGWTKFRGAQASLAEVLDLMSLPPAEAGITPKIKFSESLNLVNVSFRYAGQQHFVLDNANLRINRGATVGIVGITGSGKSTLMDIIMGLLVPEQGSVLIDGQKLTAQNASGWRAQIAHVPQDIYLTDASIRENIAFGVEPTRIDERRLHAAAVKAQIHSYIVGLPRGYYSSVGERGVQLSGGQKQRIGLARALYKEASVLVLDEATSALDSETERHVIESVNQLQGEITILIVAHRVTTLRECNQIIEISNGTVRSIAKE